MPKGASLETDPRTPVLRMIWDKYRGTGRTKKSINWQRVWDENPSFKVVLGLDESTPEKAKYSIQRVYNMMTTVRNGLPKRKKTLEPAAATVASEQPQPVAEINFCPECGCHLAIIKRGMALAAKLKRGV